MLHSKDQEIKSKAAQRLLKDIKYYKEERTQIQSKLEEMRKKDPLSYEIIVLKKALDENSSVIKDCETRLKEAESFF